MSERKPSTEVPPAESLAASVVGILARVGNPQPYDELVSLLGLGAALTVVPAEPPAHWLTYARDLALPETARLHGVQLRALHPPEAAFDLRHVAEFETHFRDSYAPLIRRAIEHEQVALVWGYWAGMPSRRWGVVTEMRGEVLAGFTVGCTGEAIPLEREAAQVYIVEGSNGAMPPSWVDKLRTAVDASLRYWPAESSGVLLGRAALEAWHGQIDEDAAKDDPGLLAGHNRCITQLEVNRELQNNWLVRLRDELSADGPEKQLAEAWTNLNQKRQEFRTALRQQLADVDWLADAERRAIAHQWIDILDETEPLALLKTWREGTGGAE